MLVTNNSKIYAGNTEIAKVYNETTVVYEKQSSTGYKRLSYIQSSGTQYIDANLPNHPNGLRAEFKWSPMTTTINQIIWGAEDASSPYNRNYFKYSSSSALELGCYGYQYISYGTALGVKYITTTNTVRYTTQNVSINGTNVYSTDNNKNFARTSLSPYIFAHNGGGSIWGYATIRLYYLRFYDENDALLRDFIPVLDENNVACLYDRVSEEYYYNAGTGTFSYGSIIADRTPINYIESNAYQTINTRYVPNYSTKVDMKLQLTSIANDRTIMVAKWDMNGFALIEYNSMFRWHNNTSTYYDFGFNGMDQTAKILSIYQNTIDIDGVNVVSGSYTLINYTDTIKLFSFDSSHISYMKLYECKISENDNLIHDYIPVLDGEEPCLYDTVTNTYYHNKKSDTFLYG